MQENKENLVFLTRGKSLEIYDFKKEQVVKSFELTSPKRALTNKSFYSPQKNYYVAFSKLDLYVIQVSDFSVILHKRVQEQTVEYLYFLNYDKYFCYVLKQNKQYKIVLCELTNNKVREIKSVETEYFKSNFEYL